MTTCFDIKNYFGINNVDTNTIINKLSCYVFLFLLITFYITIYFLQIIQSYSFVSTNKCSSNIILLERWLFAGGVTNSIIIIVLVTLYKSYKTTSNFLALKNTVNVTVSFEIMVSNITPAYVVIISFKIVWLIFGTIIFVKDYYKCSSDVNTNTLLLVSLTSEYFLFCIINCDKHYSWKYRD